MVRPMLSCGRLVEFAAEGVLAAGLGLGQFCPGPVAARGGGAAGLRGGYSSSPNVNWPLFHCASSACTWARVGALAVGLAVDALVG